jgi:hypothetical protein
MSGGSSRREETGGVQKTLLLPQLITPTMLSLH